MEKVDIKPGTIVWLKSGGPMMTVKYLSQEGLWRCSWFVSEDVKEHPFSEEQLTIKDPNPSFGGFL